MNAVVSRHARKRLKERSGLNKKAIQRMVDMAYTQGIRHSQMKGRLHKWVTSVTCKGISNATNIRAYGDKLYLFDRNILVTVIQIPPNLLKDIKNMVKEKENMDLISKDDDIPVSEHNRKTGGVYYFDENGKMVEGVPPGGISLMDSCNNSNNEGNSTG
ncbi:hypothetical protein [Blautia producta]|uniref:hypothetical protein n=1 Tax=Blautia producta TaxID=33035 RepID=UPI00356183C4